jgi:hypothetical protein
MYSSALISLSSSISFPPTLSSSPEASVFAVNLADPILRSQRQEISLLRLEIYEKPEGGERDVLLPISILEITLRSSDNEDRVAIPGLRRSAKERRISSKRPITAQA